MTEEYNNNTCGIFGLSCETRKYPIFGIAFGFMFPLIAWAFDLIYRSYGITQIWQMHVENPMHFIIDMAPVIIGITAYLLTKNIQKDQRKKLEYYIHEKETYLTKISSFTKEIGKGNYSADTINEEEKKDPLFKVLTKMKDDLSFSTQKEKEQKWLITGKEKISSVLRTHTDLNDLAYNVLKTLVDYTNVIQGAFYIFDEDTTLLKNYASYAYSRKKYINQEFKIGEGLIGQAAFELDTIYRKEIPDYYVTISSGILGNKKPGSILIVPLISDEKLRGVIEIAAIEDEIPKKVIDFVEDLSDVIGQTLFNLTINYKTNRLLEESQRMTNELQENEEELRQNAEEMIATQEELEKTNSDLEIKINEVEEAQNRMYTLLENASEIISIYDKDGVVKYESPSVSNILGYTPEEIIGTKGMSKVSEETKDIVDKSFEKLISNPEESIKVEFQYYKKDGNLVWLESIGRNMLHNSAIEGIIYNTRDITIRKLAESEQRKRGQMQALSENSPDLILRFNLKGKLYYTNPVFEKYFDLNAETVTNKSLKDINIANEVKNIFNETLAKLKKTPKKLETELEFESSFGKRIVIVNSIPEFDENKKIETVLFVFHDITVRKEFEIEIENTNKKITESINYAKRIQGAILPKTGNLQNNFPNSFIFYKPKDVVSGDFPWMFDKGDCNYFAAVDCTGHGVPGALLSFIAYFLLNNIVDQEYNQTASDILDELHLKVRETLRQEEEGANSRDGMDVAFCKYNKKTNKLEYSGAHRPLYLVRNGELIQYKGDRKAIGGIPHHKKREQNFTNYVIDIEKGDKIFIFSDGLPDQLNDKTRKKYQAKRIREIIIENKDFSMAKFSNYFAKDFVDWKGNYKQIDDVLLIGVEF